MKRHNKHFFERYAKFAVCYLLGYDREDIENKDRPDLQTKSRDLGIEVVRAISKHDGYTYNLIDRYFGKHLTGDKVIEEIRKQKHGFEGSLCTVEGRAVISAEKGIYDSNKHERCIVKAIEEKTEKWKSYDKDYNEKGVYCFSHTGLLDESDYPTIISACKASIFTLVFIDCNDEILLWRTESSEFMKHRIPEAVLSAWTEEAKQE